MRTVDVCIGTRVHGAIASIQSAVPTLCFAIDSRVRELCATMAVPTVEVEEARHWVEQHRSRSTPALTLLHNLFSHFYPCTDQLADHQELAKRNTQSYHDALKPFLSTPEVQ